VTYLFTDIALVAHVPSLLTARNPKTWVWYSDAVVVSTGGASSHAMGVVGKMAGATSRTIPCASTIRVLFPSEP